MESLRVLRESLDSSRPAGGASKWHERQLNAEFKAAALHLTNLYRSSLSSSQSSHRSGYVQGLRDILELVLLRNGQEAGQDPSELVTEYESNDVLAAAAELKWLVKYLQARIVAMGFVSEEEDLDADLERQQEQEQVSGRSHTRGPAASSSSMTSRRQQQIPPTSKTPYLQPGGGLKPGHPAEPNEVCDRSPTFFLNTLAQRTNRNIGANRSLRNTQITRSGEEDDQVHRLRSSAPSSTFSFSLPSTANNSRFEPTSGTSPFVRRKVRNSVTNSQCTTLNSHQMRSVLGSASAPTPLSPVGEEAIVRTASTSTSAGEAISLDSEARECRGNGRRGPVPRSEGERLKRRKKGMWPVGRGSVDLNDGHKDSNISDTGITEVASESA